MAAAPMPVVTVEPRERYSFGWLPDYPDFRDFTPETKEGKALKHQPGVTTESVNSMLERTGIFSVSPARLPAQTDLRPWCSPIEDQGQLGSCTANAAVGAVEYFERRAFGNFIDASRLFVYKVTRDLLHLNGDTGAYLRSTVGALAVFGVPPEEYWPYVIPDFDKEPSAFCYAFALSYQAINYYRLDPPGTTPASILARAKTNLAAYLPSIFGFTVYSSISQGQTTGKIPFPTRGERVLGGHAIMAVGYDDSIVIENPVDPRVKTTGALLIRNSWGQNWGMAGYGWLPYDYVIRGLAQDFWSIIQAKWIDTGKFKA